MSKVGHLIKTKREQLHLNIEDIAERTAVRKQFLEAIEAGDYNVMPSFVHARGFVVKYCETLGIDFNKDVKALFDEECAKESFGMTKAEIESKEMTSSMEETKRKSNIKIGIISAILIVCAIAVAFLFMNGGLAQRANTTQGERSASELTIDNSTEVEGAVTPEPVNVGEPAAIDEPAPAAPAAVNEVAPLPATTPVQTAPVTTNAPDNTSAQVRQAVQLATISFDSECWISYTTDLGESIEFIANNGITRTVRFNRFFVVNSLGNAASMTVRYGDEEFNNFGSPSQVVRNLYFVVNANSMSVSRTNPLQQG